MTTYMKRWMQYGLLGLLAFAGYACSNDDALTGEARIKVRLTDAPANYDAVLIDVREVRVKVNGRGEDDGWITLQNTNPGIYDLLQLTNGLDTLLGESSVSAGTLQQVRLVLGNQNSVVENGQTRALTTPSAQQSGLKINVQHPLEDGVTYTLLLDFDAARSIVRAGNSGNLLLRPVIRAQVMANTGAISGELLPAGTQAVVYALTGSDTLTSAYTNQQGQFMLRALLPGTYQVRIQPRSETLSPRTINNVQVNAGANTNLGEIELNN